MRPVNLVGTAKFTQVDGADIVMKSILGMTLLKAAVKNAFLFKLDFFL